MRAVYPVGECGSNVHNQRQVPFDEGELPLFVKINILKINVCHSLCCAFGQASDTQNFREMYAD
jgi:hypothetical protein